MEDLPNPEQDSASSGPGAAILLTRLVEVINNGELKTEIDAAVGDDPDLAV